MLVLGVIIAANPASGSPANTPDVIHKYCTPCHNERLRTAGLAFEKLELAKAGAQADVWEKIVRKIRAGEMPPAGMPRPDRRTMDAFASAVEEVLDSAPPNPGRVVLHRLNRSEYGNVIRDMLDLEIDSSALLPPDDADQNGFENIAGVLSVSPRLLDGYMSTAGRISRLAVGDPTLVPVFDTYSVPKTAAQDDRMGEDLPFGSRGGIAVHYRFPVDAQYVLRVRLRRQLYDYIVGLGHAQRLDVRVDGRRMASMTVGGEAHGLPAPATFAGAVPGDSAWEEYLHSADANLQVRFPAKAGTRILSVSFVNERSEPESFVQSRNSTFGLSSDEQFDGEAAVDSIEIGGPYNVQGPGDTASRRRIFICHPVQGEEPTPCVTKILSNLVRRAFRRPSTSKDIAPLLRIYSLGSRSRGFEGGVELALQAILSDPEFLFRVDSAPAGVSPGSIFRLSDLQLASRLSFFLWSSIPDDELLAAAIRGELRNPAVLEREVRRMLRDDRAKSLVTNFASQWLDLRKIRGVSPDPVRYPEFDDSLRQAFETETRMFLESQIHADRSVKELLTAYYTFVNERLAKHYGIGNVYGSYFRRVPVGSNREGLLGEGSILTLTSYPDRTSPVLRGKWLLDNVLGMPPSPPPPDVPALKETGADGKIASVRERMEQHRKNPACAVCHLKMDPLGFALENFDAVGKWRVSSDGIPIDASASLPDGTKFDGAAGLRTVLAARSGEFVRTVTEKLLTYALGRELQAYDFPAVRGILRAAAASDYRWSAIILGIVKSTPFQMSTAENKQPEEATNDAAW